MPDTLPPSLTSARTPTNAVSPIALLSDPRTRVCVGIFGKGMAGTTRLELATSAVTGQRSNQLNYVPASFANLPWPRVCTGWWGLRSRWLRHAAESAFALVGSAGFEPATSSL